MLLLGDKLILKVASYNPKSVLLAEGLEALKNELPEPAANIIEKAEEAPHSLWEAVKKLLSGDKGTVAEPVLSETEKTSYVYDDTMLGDSTGEFAEPATKEPNPTPDNGDVDNADKLVASMKSLMESASDYKKALTNHNHKAMKANDFYLDDFSLYMGAPYTLSPPYTTP